jgi:F0F1-type ATP synthase assembly protein I
VEWCVSANRPASVIKNLALAGALSQVGCVTVAIVIGALLAGLWLDNRFDTKPMFTIALLAASMPMSLLAVVRIALSAAAQFQADVKPEGKKEEGN